MEGADAQDGICTRDEANYNTRNRVEDNCNPGLVCRKNTSEVFKNEEALVLTDIF